MTNAAFIGTPEDREHVPLLKHMFNGLNTYVLLEPITLLTQLEMYCAKRDVTRVASTSPQLLQKFLELSGSDEKIKSIGDYAGSLFSYRGISVVFLSPLEQLRTITYAKFLCQRWISKVAAPESWPEATKFMWEFLDSPSRIEAAYTHLSSAYAIAVDIETFKHNLAIRCISYTGIFFDSSGKPTTTSYVIPVNSSYNLAWMRKFNALPVQKIFQNGKYDNSYLLRYNAPVRNWQWDTINQFHSWYSELPKDLGILGAFFIRDVVYWKDLSETKDLFEFYKYNALDTWATANVWIQWILQSPEWAKRNYALEFPLVFPCLLAEMTGVIRDEKRLLETRAEIDAKENRTLESLRKCLGSQTFNPGSHVQVKNLLEVVGCGDLQSSDEIHLKKASVRHPLNALLFGKVLAIRGYRKLRSNYLRISSDGEEGKDNGAKEFNGTILYALNPHGTDSGRLASREHHFWIGLQIQNVSSRDGPEAKQTFIAPPGFYFGESVLEQAESRDTANISGDENLIAAVSGTRDFHSVNCSSFFGVSYVDIFDDATRKTKNKPLRDLAKRVNHGANYNMGASVLVDTMGLDKIWEARKLLKLSWFDPKKIASYLLERFHNTYPKIKGAFYPAITREVMTTKKIVSRAYHHTEWNLKTFPNVEAYIEEGDWTRYCFGNPEKSKSDLNSYISHPPQSLNARTLNEAWMKVFYDIALPNPTTFRLHAQIHDSILFSYRGGYESHAERVRECMEIPVTVRDVSGTYRTFTVPAALKIGKPGKPAKYWSETE